MKKLIKQAFIMSSVILCLAITSCTKETGPQGPQGVAGTPGVNGNANVTQISFGSTTVSTSTTLTLAGINRATAEKSLILSYGKASNNIWYQLPGFTNSAGVAEFRTYLEAQDPASALTILKVSGPAETFSAIRVLVIPATGRNGNATYDESNYESVRAYFNLPE